MKVVIIEDEELAARRLEGMIKKYDASVEILEKLTSVEDAVAWFKENDEPDIIFLDIHLEDGLSFSIFEKVSVTAPIIFTTAFDEYAIKAFKHKSIDYLLKPVIQEELNAGIEKYKAWNKTGKEAIDVNELYKLISQKEPEYKTRFSLTIGTKIKTFDIEDIAYFYSEGGLTFMVTQNKTPYPVDYSLDNLSDQLNPKDFFRINRQYLIKLKSIKNVHIFPKSRLKIELNPASDTDVYVSLDKVTKFKEWLDS
jgi:DNA-binding LytR/AlgR family response regulator